MYICTTSLLLQRYSHYVSYIMFGFLFNQINEKAILLKTQTDSFCGNNFFVSSSQKYHKPTVAGTLYQTNTVRYHPQSTPPTIYTTRNQHQSQRNPPDSLHSSIKSINTPPYTALNHDERINRPSSLRISPTHRSLHPQQNRPHLQYMLPRLPIP